jgi:hypothetical protein
MGIGKGYDLLRVGGIGENFLVPGKRSIKYNLAYRLAIGADGRTPEYGAICKCEHGFPSNLGLHITSKTLTDLINGSLLQ